RGDDDGRVRRAGTGQGNRFVVHTTAQIERVAGLEPLHAVLDRPPRLRLRPVVRVVALECIHEVSGALRLWAGERGRERALGGVARGGGGGRGGGGDVPSGAARGEAVGNSTGRGVATRRGRGPSFWGGGWVGHGSMCTRLAQSSHAAANSRTRPGSFAARSV